MVHFYVLCSKNILTKLVGNHKPTCPCVKMEFVVGTIPLSCELFSLSKVRAGLKPMHPVQLHYAPRHSRGTFCPFLPDNPYAKEL